MVRVQYATGPCAGKVNKKGTIPLTMKPEDLP
jgi:hypothetical protein